MARALVQSCFRIFVWLQKKLSASGYHRALLKVWLGGAILALSPQAAHGTPVAESGDNPQKFLHVGLLLQPQYRLNEEPRSGSSRTGWVSGASLRRARIILSGQLNDQVNFFADTDITRFGEVDAQGERFRERFFFQDAWVEYVISPALQIDSGLLLLPFSHHGMQGAMTLLGIDVRGDGLRGPAGGDFGWRDMGVMLRGLVNDQRLDYRVAITKGVPRHEDAATTSADTINDRDLPRVTGHLTYNFFEAEGGPGAAGYFWDGLYLREEKGRLLSPKKIVSLGVSATYQPDALINANGQVHDYLGLAGDAFIDLPLGDATRSLNAQLNCYFYDFGQGHASSGHGCMLEAGYRVERLEPLLALELFDVRAHQVAGDRIAARAGLAWWIHGHSATVKVEVGGERQERAAGGGGDPTLLSARVQTQLLF